MFDDAAKIVICWEVLRLDRKRICMTKSYQIRIRAKTERIGSTEHRRNMYYFEKSEELAWEGWCSCDSLRTESLVPVGQDQVRTAEPQHGICTLTLKRRGGEKKRRTQSRFNNLVVIVWKINTWDYGVHQLPPTLHSMIIISIVVDPHWFQRGNESSISAQRGSISRVEEDDVQL